MSNPRGEDGHYLDSPRAGGKYFITRTAAITLENCDECTKALLTTWLIDQRRLGEEIPKIGSNTIEEVKKRQSLSIPERADRLLKYIESQASSYPGEIFYFFMINRTFPEMLAWSESKTNEREGFEAKEQIQFFIAYLLKRGWIIRGDGGRSDSPVSCKLTVEGYAHLDELGHKVTISSKAFVAMWFDKSMKDTWEKGIKPAIEESGYEPVRIDQKQHSNKIDDEIIAEIRRSRFIVADFTHGDEGARGGVYYEAGFARGLNIPVIFTCREDVFEKIHFDTRQYNHIVWETPEELRQKLTARIAAEIGDGPNISPNG
jgi:hypothetical protein